MTFSIIIPVYNVAPYLRECLDSVLAQTYADWEAICVDDGSTDGSGAILDEYAKLDDRFHAFHMRNMGVSLARNVGIEESVGQYVCFIDSDDALVPQALARLLQVVEETQGDYIYFKHADICGELEPIEKQSRYVKQSYVSYDMSVLTHSANALARCYWAAGAWNVCYKRECVGNSRFPVQKMSEDVCFAMECLKRAKRVVGLDDILYLYRQRPGSATRITTLNRFREDMHSFGVTFEFAREMRPFLLARSRIRRRFLKRLSQHVLTALSRYPESLHGDMWIILREELSPVMTSQDFAPWLIRVIYGLFFAHVGRRAFQLFVVRPVWALERLGYEL